MSDDKTRPDNEYDETLAILFADAPAAPQDPARAQSQESRLLSIDEVARQTDLPKPTLRFYEQKGLVEPPPRLPRKFRKYSPEDIDRLEHVKQLRDLLGLSLTEIEDTLRIDKERKRLAEEVRAQWRETSDTTVKKTWLDEARRLNQRQIEDVDKQLGAIEDRIEGLQRLRDEMRERRERIQDATRRLRESESSLDTAGKTNKAGKSKAR
jgi:DNA-binding transcriptional MerR regulator